MHFSISNLNKKNQNSHASTKNSRISPGLVSLGGEEIAKKKNQFLKIGSSRHSFFKYYRWASSEAFTRKDPNSPAYDSLLYFIKHFSRGRSAISKGIFNFRKLAIIFNKVSNPFASELYLDGKRFKKLVGVTPKKGFGAGAFSNRFFKKTYSAGSYKLLLKYLNKVLARVRTSGFRYRSRGYYRPAKDSTSGGSNKIKFTLGGSASKKDLLIRRINRTLFLNDLDFLLVKRAAEKNSVEYNAPVEEH
jgi:hypothetical protein